MVRFKLDLKVHRMLQFRMELGEQFLELHMIVWTHVNW